MKNQKLVAAGVIIGGMAGVICAVLSTVFLPVMTAACIGTAALAGGTLAGAAIADELTNILCAADGDR